MGVSEPKACLLIQNDVSRFTGPHLAGYGVSCGFFKGMGGIIMGKKSVEVLFFISFLVFKLL